MEKYVVAIKPKNASGRGRYIFDSVDPVGADEVGRILLSRWNGEEKAAKLVDSGASGVRFLCGLDDPNDACRRETSPIFRFDSLFEIEARIFVRDLPEFPDVFFLWQEGVWTFGVPRRVRWLGEERWDTGGCGVGPGRLNGCSEWKLLDYYVNEGIKL